MTETFELQDWQKVVVNMIGQHEDLIGGQKYLSMGDFERNNSTAIRLHLPGESGHSTLTAWLATHKDDVMLVFTNMEHWNNIAQIRSSRNWGIQSNFQAVSAYEIFYAIQEQNRGIPSQIFESLKDKFIKSKIIVVDDSCKMPDLVKDFILQVAKDTTTIVMLG